ncbi:MAG: DNA polymerase III subunit gamma/tau C-terminal domain-containing protein, partial [Methylotenera sp.]
ALSLTDQAIAYGGQTVNEAEVRAMLGAIDQSYLYQLLDALLENDGSNLIAQAKAMEERSLPFEAALNDLAQLLHQVAVAQTVPDSIADDLPERNALLNLAQKISPETLQLYYQIALLGRRDIGLAPDEFAGFTMSLLRMLAFTPNEANVQKAQNNSLNKPLSASLANTPKPQLVVKPVEPITSKVISTEQPTENSATFTIDSPDIQTAPTANEAPIERNIKNAESTNDSSNFNGNWRGLLDELKLGLVRTLAQHCELVSFDENSISLSVPESQKHLLLPNYQEKLGAAICQYFGKKIKLQFSIGGTGNTPAKQISQEKAHAQANAESAIEDDSFVQALINDFGASIIPNSIKPI